MTNSSSSDDGIILDGDQLQALHTLVRSYLTSLSVPVRFEEKNIDCNMFGNRYMYLDLLPPFGSKTNANVKDQMMNADSPEVRIFHCLFNFKCTTLTVLFLKFTVLVPK